MFWFKWHHISLDRDYFKTPTPERNWDEARFKLISLQIRLPAASATGASRICRLAEMKIFQSCRMTAYRWEHGRGWRRPAPTQRPLFCTSCWRRQTNKHTVWSDSVWPLGKQEEECFSGGLRAIRICTFKEVRSFQWRQILWINSTSSHSGSPSFCSFYTEIIVYTSSSPKILSHLRISTPNITTSRNNCSTFWEIFTKDWTFSSALPTTLTHSILTPSKYLKEQFAQKCHLSLSTHAEDKTSEVS